MSFYFFPGKGVLELCGVLLPAILCKRSMPNDVSYTVSYVYLCTGQFQNRPCPPPGQTPGHLTFLKNVGQIPRYVASLDGQMPHPLELQRGSKPPPSRHVKANCGNKFCKIFSHYEFLVQLVFAPLLKQRHIPRYNYIKRQQQRNQRGIDKSNDP